MAGPNGQSRVAVVTGGLTGIGLAVARDLLAAGHRVAVGSRQGGQPQALALAREALGDTALIGELDVASQASVDGFLAKVRGRLGPVTILVNAAGIYREAFFPDHSDAAWTDQIEINLTGPFRMIRALWPDMLTAGWGRIANIASTAGTKGAAGYAAYCASKAGLIGLTKSVAVEGAPHGINAIAISPTWVETPMMDNAIQRMVKAGGGDSAEARAALSRSNPQGRLVQPSEVASLVDLFCSDAALGLTNVDIQINAGADW